MTHADGELEAQDTELGAVIRCMSELCEDPTLPKNIKDKLEFLMELLAQPIDFSLRISRALHELEELAEDKNLQSYTRTALFNLISSLEASWR